MLKPLIIVATIALLILVAVTGRYILTNTRPKIPPTTEASPIVTQPCSTVSTKAVAAPDWKTYTNRTYSYSVNYPSRWQPHTTNSEDSVSFSSPDLQYSEDSGYPAQGAMINVDVRESNLKNIDELYNQVSNNKYVQIKAREDIVINGTRGLRLEVNGLEMPSGSDVYFVRDGKSYTFQYWQVGANYREVFDQMLCTLRFAE